MLIRRFFRVENLLAAIVALVSMPSMAQNSVLSLRWMHDDNVNFTPSSDQVVSDQALQISAQTRFQKRLSPFSDVSLTGRVEYHDCKDIACDHVDLNVAAAYSKKLGLGLQAPRLTFGLSAESQNYEVDLRDVFVNRLSAGISKPVHDRVDLAFKVSVHAHRVKHEQPRSANPAVAFQRNAFDRDFVRAELSSLVYLDSDWSMPIRLALVDGDVVSISRPDPLVLAQAAAADDYSAIQRGTVAYRSEGQARSLAIGINRSLTANSSVSFEYTTQSAETGTNTKYSRHLTSLEYSFRW